MIAYLVGLLLEGLSAIQSGDERPNLVRVAREIRRLDDQPPRRPASSS
ncbi:MAG TPA: hypothetical protein VGV64_02150 [Thermoplasmata archaeon]|nr:hypothetical protein [Thermoplasmata archaeon]